MNISIQPFTAAELEATDAVIMAAYHIEHSRKENLLRYLALQPGGSFVALHNGTVVGFGGVMDYGPFAYIGLMCVHPSMQKRGIAGLLMEQLLAWLDARGCPTILLDASTAGIPLYKHYGFIEEDETLVLQQTQAISLPRYPSTGISIAAEQDLPALMAFDASYFGAERGALLTSYWEDNPQRVLLAQDVHGQLHGYLIAQSRVLGPWLARTVQDAERLLVHALTLPFENGLQVFVSASNNDALALLKRYGFCPQRALSHMRKGQFVQRSRHTVLYGQVSLGFG